jgi:hypothetical protein
VISTSTLDVASWVLATAKTALEDCGRDPISTSYVGAGEIAWDDCCGTLIVVPDRVYRSQEFPSEDTSEVICFDGFIAIDFAVTLLRCVPVVDDRGRAPEDTALAVAYADLLGDAAVIYNALTGAFPEYWERTNPSQTFLGAQGGCIGVETRITIGLEQSRFGICCTNPEPHEPGDPICAIKASAVEFVPCEGLLSTNVQDAICELAATIPGPTTSPLYLSAVSSDDQTTTVGTATEMAFPVVIESSEVSLVGSTRFTVTRAALINLQFSAQLHHRGGGGNGETVNIWFAINGVAIPDTATRLIVPNSRFVVAAWNIFIRLVPGEEISIVWNTDNASIALEHIVASGVVPAIPSVIVTVHEVK